MASIQGRILSRSACSPPTIKVKVPALAPGVEPVQGTSIYRTPFLANSAPIFRLPLGEIVLASATMVPALTPSITPPEPRFTCSDIAVSPTQRKTHSAFCAASLGLEQNLPFSAAASSFALSAVCDHNATSCPARRRLRAIGYP